MALSGSSGPAEEGGLGNAPWQRDALDHLRLTGPGADLEVGCRSTTYSLSAYQFGLAYSCRKITT